MASKSDNNKLTVNALKLDTELGEERFEYRPDIKVIAPVSIPKSELDIWTISTLHEYIFSRIGLERDCYHVLVIGGTILKKKFSSKTD